MDIYDEEDWTEMDIEDLSDVCNLTLAVTLGLI
jgi:hypothetical protein